MNALLNSPYLKIRKGFALIILSVFIIYGVGRHFWYRTNNTYWEVMNDTRLRKIKETKPTYFDGELEPVFPEDEDNSATFFGIDTNKNGVRDDIEIWINRNFQTRNERMAYKQYQKAINVFYSNIRNENESFQSITNKVKRLTVDEHRASICVTYVETELKNKNSKRDFSLDLVKMKLVDQLTYNSFHRRESKNEFWSWSNGEDDTTYGLEDYGYNEHYKYCKFKLDNF